MNVKCPRNKQFPQVEIASCEYQLTRKQITRKVTEIHCSNVREDCIVNFCKDIFSLVFCCLVGIYINFPLNRKWLLLCVCACVRMFVFMQCSVINSKVFHCDR